MARIICVTTGLTGILNASFELVKQLKSTGHEVAYASPRVVGERVEAQGISFLQLPPIELKYDTDIPDFKGPWRKLNRLKYKLVHSASRKATAVQKTTPKVFSDLLESKRPDLLIIDIELHEYIFAAYTKKVPFVLLSQWFSLWKRPGLPYLLHDTIPGNGWHGSSLGIEWSWQKVKWKRNFLFWKQKWLSGKTDRRTLLLDLARQNNFPLKWIKENYWPGPFTYDQLPVISMTMEEMEFPHNSRPNLFYVGAMVDEQRIDISLTEKERKLLDKAFEYKRSKGAALIYCTVSTLSKGDQHFIRKLIEAMRDRPDWLLVIGMGGLIDPEKIDQLPDNVFAFKRVPQLEVLKEADCSINHGGIHTINECIHFEVPMLVYSGKRSDQNGCAARVAYHQLGFMADKDKDDAISIRTNIKEVLKNEIYKQKLKALHQQYQKKKEDCYVGQIINSFLAKN